MRFHLFVFILILQWHYCLLLCLGFKPVVHKVQHSLHHNQGKAMMAFDTIVKVASQMQAPCALHTDGAGVSLDHYMQLPVEQYVCIKMPLAATLERVTRSEEDDAISNRFNLTVPPVRFFHLQVSPMLFCNVTQSSHSVIIESNECILRGSPSVVGLNGCFKFHVRTVFNWVDTPSRKIIKSRSSIFVRVDPPPPFSSFPRELLEYTGNTAMGFALREIENAFVKSLAKDYARWANDALYRRERELESQVPSESLSVVVTDSVLKNKNNEHRGSASIRNDRNVRSGRTSTALRMSSSDNDYPSPSMLRPDDGNKIIRATTRSDSKNPYGDYYVTTPIDTGSHYKNSEIHNELSPSAAMRAIAHDSARSATAAYQRRKAQDQLAERIERSKNIEQARTKRRPRKSFRERIAPVIGSMANNAVNRRLGSAVRSMPVRVTRVDPNATVQKEGGILRRGLAALQRRLPMSRSQSNSSAVNEHAQINIRQSKKSYVPKSRSSTSGTKNTRNSTIATGVPMVEIHKAPDNSRRIYCAIAIAATVDDVWSVLTDYRHLHEVVPSLASSKVIGMFPNGGVRLQQVGTAKLVSGFNFKARTTLDVKSYSESSPLPAPKRSKPFQSLESKRALSKEGHNTDPELVPLRKGVFPQPPTALIDAAYRDLTMQAANSASGDFDHFQAVWRLQRLPTAGMRKVDGQLGKAVPLMQLSYAVEIKPRGLLPVRLIENRIASDLRSNLLAIKHTVEEKRQITELQEKLGAKSSTKLNQMKAVNDKVVRNNHLSSSSGKIPDQSSPPVVKVKKSSMQRQEKSAPRKDTRTIEKENAELRKRIAAVSAPSNTVANQATEDSLGSGERFHRLQKARSWLRGKVNSFFGGANSDENNKITVADAPKAVSVSKSGEVDSRKISTVPARATSPVPADAGDSQKGIRGRIGQQMQRVFKTSATDATADVPPSEKRKSRWPKGRRTRLKEEQEALNKLLEKRTVEMKKEIARQQLKMKIAAYKKRKGR